MVSQWAGEIVGKLHINNISQKELAQKMGITAVYLSEVLNGKKNPKGAEERINAALNELIAKKAAG